MKINQEERSTKKVTVLIHHFCAGWQKVGDTRDKVPRTYRLEPGPIDLRKRKRGEGKKRGQKRKEKKRRRKKEGKNKEKRREKGNNFCFE